jgi:uncharacterized protein Yka (UPF0111/DUF47 family)
MSTADLIQREEPVMKIRFVRALEFLKQNIPEEKQDDFHEFLDRINELVKTGEKIDVGEMVAELLDPRKFGLPQDLIEEFLKYLIGNVPDAEKIISGTIEYAKRKLWRRGR